MKLALLLLASLAACSTRATQPPPGAATTSCQPKPIPACPADLSPVAVAALSSTVPAAGTEVAVAGHLRRSDLVRCFTSQICIEGKCSSSCASPLVVSSTAEPTAAQREQLATRPMVAPGDVATQSSCEGDEKTLCCPFEAAASEVVVTGTIVADAETPENWRIDVASVCRPAAR